MSCRDCPQLAAFYRAAASGSVPALCSKKQIADDTDGIIILNSAVPVLYDGCVHYLYRLKRTVAKLQDMLVSKVRISYEIKHSITSQLFVDSIYERIPLHKCAI